MGPCHALPVVTRPLVCYVALSACKRSAESQTLKVHPVASKTLTQKRPVYAAPERLVGDFSFSIVFFLGMVTWSKWTNPWSSSHTHTLSQRLNCDALGGVLVEPCSSETVARLHCRCAAFGGAGASGASQMGVLQPPSAPPSYLWRVTHRLCNCLFLKPVSHHWLLCCRLPTHRNL